jgi:hypothetical protein
VPLPPLAHGCPFCRGLSGCPDSLAFRSPTAEHERREHHKRRDAKVGGQCHHQARPLPASSMSMVKALRHNPFRPDVRQPDNSVSRSPSGVSPTLGPADQAQSDKRRTTGREIITQSADAPLPHLQRELLELSTAQQHGADWRNLLEKISLELTSTRYGFHSGSCLRFRPVAFPIVR